MNPALTVFVKECRESLRDRRVLLNSLLLGPLLGPLLFLVMIVQLSDVFQYIWGKLLGKHKIAPTISPNKTWEGFVGGIATACALGTGLWWMTPFTPLQRKTSGIKLSRLRPETERIAHTHLTVDT